MKAIPMLCSVARRRGAFGRLAVIVTAGLMAQGSFAQTPAQISALAKLGSIRPRLTPQSGIEATTTQLALPAGIAFDATGNLYIADLNDNIIRRVDVAGIITTVAGDGDQGFAGDGGAPTDAQLDSPAGVAVDASGNLFIADTHNQRIRRVAGGNITTIAGTGVAGFSGDGGAAASAMLNQPTALAVGPDGSLYVADTDNHRIRKIVFGSNSTTITTVAGNGEQFFSGDGAAATLAGLDSPNGVAVDAAGSIYIGDTHNQRVRVIDAAGLISTLAGNGNKTYSGDGAAAIDASLARPRGLSVDAIGNIYVADSDNNRIRLIAKTGIIATLAGNGSQGFTGDGGSAVNATLDTPRATAVAATGVVALSDTNNQRVREVSADGSINTIAGLSPTAGGASLGESLLLNGASTAVYGGGSLTTTFSNNGQIATGTVTLLDITGGGLVPIGGGTLAGNAATISVASVSAGLHKIVANYSGDLNNPAITSGVFLLTVTQLPLTASATGIAQPYGQPIPTITGTLSGVLPQDAGNVTAVFSTTAASMSPAGQYPITVSLVGPAAGNYTVALSTGSGDVSIRRAASTIALTSSNVAPFLGASVTLTAQVGSTTTGIPTGSVTFYEGATVLSTAAVDATGSVAYSTSAFAAGAHSITAVYSGDTNFSNATSAATIETVGALPDFTIASAGATAQMVSPGQNATYNFTVQSQGAAFPTSVTLTASGLPAGATATFAPATIAPGSITTTFNLSIQAPMATTSVVPSSSRNPLLPVSAALFLLPLMGNKRLRTRLGRMSRTLFGVILLLLSGAALLGLTGCGSGGFSPRNPESYNITVTATATSTVGTTLQHATTVTLVVQ